MGAIVNRRSIAQTVLMWMTAVFMFAGTLPATAQPYITRTYALEEGLIQSQASAILQDSDGYLWIGTYGGLSRFDGLNFVNYTVDEGLISNRIQALTQDAAGQLWVGTINGISVLNDTSFTHLTTAQGLLDNTVNDLLTASDGIIWIASQSGLSKYEGGSFTHFEKVDGLPSSIVISVFEAPDKTIWFTTTAGLCSIKADGFNCYAAEDGLPNPFVTNVLIDRKQRVWAATLNGMALLTTDGTNRFVEQPAVKGLRVSSLIEDSQGAIWVGSREGVVRLDTTGTLTHSWLDGNWITLPLLEDTEGNIWAGTSGRGLVKFQQTAFTHINPIYNLPKDVYLGVFEDSKRRCWFGTMLNGFYKVDLKGVKHYSRDAYPSLEHVRSFAEDSDGNLWLGTANGAHKFDGENMTQYTAADGLVSSYVFSVQPDREGRIWVGTANGVSVIDTDSISTIDLDLGAEQKLVFTIEQGMRNRVWIGTIQGLMYYENDQLHKVDAVRKRPIMTVREDNSGDLWLGTLGFGVLRYRPSTGEVVDSLTVADGLNSATVYFTEFDGLGDLWVGTSLGVNHVDMETYRMEGEKKVRAFGKNDGIVGVETNGNAAIMDHAGRLWFGTIDAILHYDTSPRPENTTPPPIHLTKTRLFFEDVTLEDYQKDQSMPVTFAYNENHLTFDFLGLSYTVPEMVKYQYRMAGFDADWLPASAMRSATYSNLPAGEYTFEVKAINNDALASAQPASMSFVITPPFWKTPWFIALSVSLSILGIVGIVQLRTRNLNRRRIELEETVAARTEDLRNTHSELMEAREAALQAAKSKSAFMSAMTHELRTPMNGILGMTQVLTVTEMDEEQMDCAQTIMECSTMMMDLIENLLTFADLAAGKRTLTIERFPLPDLLNETISAIRSKSVAKQIETRYFLGPAVPHEIEADREHTRQILHHLLSNAVKFTQTGIVYVEVQLERQAQEQPPASNLLFSVHDTGIGMEKHQLQKVFEAFSQADASVTRQFQGTGIGLALVQQLTRLLNGNLGAKSWPGIGSSFYFSLPLQQKHIPELLPEHNTTPLAGKRILIDIKDERERRRLKLLCRSFGMEIAQPQFADSPDPIDIVLTDPAGVAKAAFYQNAALVLLHTSDATKSAGAVLKPEAEGEEVERVLRSVCQMIADDHSM